MSETGYKCLVYFKGKDGLGNCDDECQWWHDGCPGAILKEQAIGMRKFDCEYLLGWLDEMLGAKDYIDERFTTRYQYWGKEDQQAYDQIVAIIQNHILVRKSTKTGGGE